MVWKKDRVKDVGNDKYLYIGEKKVINRSWIQYFLNVLIRKGEDYEVQLNSYLKASLARGAALFKLELAFKVKATYKEKVEFDIKYLDNWT